MSNEWNSFFMKTTSSVENALTFKYLLTSYDSTQKNRRREKQQNYWLRAFVWDEVEIICNKYLLILKSVCCDGFLCSKCKKYVAVSESSKDLNYEEFWQMLWLFHVADGPWLSNGPGFQKALPSLPFPLKSKQVLFCWKYVFAYIWRKHMWFLC